MAMAWRCLTTLATGGQDVVKAGRSEQVTSHHPPRIMWEKYRLVTPI